MRQTLLAHPQNKLEKQLINLFHYSDLPLYFNKTGYKDFTNYQRLSLILIYRREGKPIRDFLEWLIESKRFSWLDLKYIPKKSTFYDLLNWFDMELISSLINSSVDKSDLKVVAIDGSEIPTWAIGEDLARSSADGRINFALWVSS